jgi:hypothetical protein
MHATYMLFAGGKLRRELLVVQGEVLQVGAPCAQAGDASGAAGTMSSKKLKQIVG